MPLPLNDLDDRRFDDLVGRAFPLQVVGGR